MNWSDIRHFKPFEFDSPDSPGSGLKMDIGFIVKLDAVRDMVGIPFSIHSGYRTPEYNATVGGVDSSAHESGHASDVGALSGTMKFLIIEAAIKIGFTRIGVGNSFVHLDDDLTKAQNVCWLYPPNVSRSS